MVPCIYADTYAFDLRCGLVAFPLSNPLHRNAVHPYCCFEAYRLVYEPHPVAYGPPAYNLGLLSAPHTLPSPLGLKGSFLRDTYCTTHE